MELIDVGMILACLIGLVGFCLVFYGLMWFAENKK